MMHLFMRSIHTFDETVYEKHSYLWSTCLWEAFILVMHLFMRIHTCDAPVCEKQSYLWCPCLWEAFVLDMQLFMRSIHTCEAPVYREAFILVMHPFMRIHTCDAHVYEKHSYLWCTCLWGFRIVMHLFMRSSHTCETPVYEKHSCLWCTCSGSYT